MTIQWQIQDFSKGRGLTIHPSHPLDLPLPYITLSFSNFVIMENIVLYCAYLMFKILSREALAVLFE